MGMITLRSRDIDSEYIYANWCTFLVPNTAVALDGNEVLAFIRGFRPPGRSADLLPVADLHDADGSYRPPRPGAVGFRRWPYVVPMHSGPSARDTEARFPLHAPSGARREHRSP